ncbi:uncharacterized protein LOC143133160 [Alosa pseudoharengus]|uniref:uncharacterized protein LOC143133160 n=1 Tax=Alosa pseudoharengus TaxID=34774 RepID=UPI003F8C3013
MSVSRLRVKTLFFLFFILNMTSGTCEEAEVETVVSVEGDSVTFVCQYNVIKQLCRPPDGRTSCNVDDLLVIASQNMNTQHGRYFLNMGGDGRPFNVTITALRAEDAGIYLCGSSVVRLTIEKAFRPIILVVSLAVAVVVVVVGAAILLFFRYRRHNRPVIWNMRHAQSNSCQLEQTDCTYEEIVDTNTSTNTSRTADAGLDSVVAMAQLPRVPCVDPTYSLAALPTIPSDDPSYSVAELPTIPSDDLTYGHG